MRAAFLLSIPILLAQVSRAGPPQPHPRRGATTVPEAEPGVSDALARDRVARISGVHYTVTFRIPASKAEPIEGSEVITFELRDTAAPVVLDFRPDAGGRLYKVTVVRDEADVPIAAQQRNGHIILPSAALMKGWNTIAISFRAGNAPLNRNDEFLYTIFVPARAHEAFPCFDQPDLKARWTLLLEIPEGWETLANAAEARRDSADGRTLVRFGETEPISTYLFAFAAGKFSMERAQRDGRTFRMFHRETDAQKVARNRDAIFDLHAAALKWLEAYTGIPYPFGKFDFLLVPAFQFGGMEHPGAIFYNASGLMLEESATQNEKLGRASVISHETSHLWFGDLVTMQWFNDVWMKEVMANFMAAKIVNPSFPEINHELRFLLAHYPSAYDVDRTRGTNAIRQRLANLSEAGTLYGAIIYQKAPIVMRQLETIVGADTYRDGLREYLQRYSFATAAWPDLIDILDGRTPEDLKTWSQAWVEEAGRPIVATRLDVADGRITRLSLTERDPVEARGLLWNQQLQVAVGYADGVKLLPVTLNAASVDVTDAAGLPAPLFVLPNGGGIGYGEFHLDSGSLGYLVGNLPDIGDALTRGSAWVTLWDAMLDREVRPDGVIALALRALPREGDEQNAQRILTYLNQAYWRFTPAATRRDVAPKVEQVLRDGLAAAKSTSLKSAYFSTLRDVARTPETIAWLTRVWRQDEQVPGLTFSERDYMQMAEELAVRDVPEAGSVVDRQIERTKNPDRQAQLVFVKPALSGDPAVRDRFFASLADVANRRHEPWVLEGLRYLHHPLRAASAEKYIAPSLAMLQDIQRTGDIFFPKRWMDATLGGHQTATAARLVRTFLDRLPPGYPDRLRRVVLSAADDLFRATDGGHR